MAMATEHVGGVVLLEPKTEGWNGQCVSQTATKDSAYRFNLHAECVHEANGNEVG